MLNSSLWFRCPPRYFYHDQTRTAQNLRMANNSEDAVNLEIADCAVISDSLQGGSLLLVLEQVRCGL